MLCCVCESSKNTLKVKIVVNRAPAASALRLCLHVLTKILTQYSFCSGSILWKASRKSEGQHSWKKLICELPFPLRLRLYDRFELSRQALLSLQTLYLDYYSCIAVCSLKMQIRKLQTSGPGQRLSMRKSLMPSDLAEVLAAGRNFKALTNIGVCF